MFEIMDCDTNWEKAKRVLVFSQYAKKVHQKLGVPKDMLEVEYPGIQGNYKESKRGREGKVEILFVGTWFERKGGPILLEAFERLSGMYPNLKLTVVGEVPKKFTVDSSQLTVHRYVPREKLLRDFFPNADIFVLVPPKVEGFGFAVLEAMSFGIPTIVTDVCALPELVENGKTGFVIEPGNLNDLTEKLEVLVKNKKLRNKMGDAAREQFKERYSIEKSNENLWEVYKQAIKSF